VPKLALPQDPICCQPLLLLPRCTWSFCPSENRRQTAEASDTSGHGDLAGHRRRAHPAATSPRGADPGPLAAADDRVADRRLLRVLRTGPRVHGAGAAGDKGFAGAAVTSRRRLLAGVTSSGPAGGPYLPTLLALRKDRCSSRPCAPCRSPPRCWSSTPPAATIPRRAGLALHLGAVLGLPTVGVTTRPLVAQGAWPVDQRAATAPLLLDNEVVGRWVRTRAGARPVAVHASWQTDAQDAVQVVLAATRRARTPEPLRRARTLARTRRAHTR
jgi:deoxyribonuclease V